jgi:hypothetical protein
MAELLIQMVWGVVKFPIVEIVLLDGRKEGLLLVEFRRAALHKL